MSARRAVGSRGEGAAASGGDSPPWSLDVAGRSVVGAVRERNEDQYLVARLGTGAEVVVSSLTERSLASTGSEERWLLAVADGMGGHAEGDVASRLALETILDEIASRPLEGKEVEKELASALLAGAAAVESAGREQGDPRPMGTTFTGCLLSGRRLFVFHAGDSRAYLLRDGELRRLTRDHTLAQVLLDRGTLQAEDLEGSPLTHQLLNTLGGGDEATEPELHTEEVEPGDRVLLCTDGLTAGVSDEEIVEVLGSALSAESMIDSLIELAEERGSQDNVTVVLARVEPAVD